MMLKCHRRSRAATRLGGSHAKVFYRVRDGRPPEVDHRLRPRRGHRRGRDEEVPRQPLGRDRRSGWIGLPRAVARGLRERLPRLRPAKGARRARRRVRRRRGLQGPEVGRRPRPSKNDRNDAARMAKAILAARHLPGMGALPRGREASGTSPAPTTRRPRGWRRPSSGSWPSSPSRGYAYGGTTPAGNPRKYWTYGFLRWLDEHTAPPTTAASGRSRR